MPRKKLNNDQQQIVYCLIARLRDPNYNSGFDGFAFVQDEIEQAVELYLEVSDLKRDFRNWVREKFNGITLEEVKKGKAEGIINTFQQTAKQECRSLYDFISKLILPKDLDDHRMEFWSDKAKTKSVSRYFSRTIRALQYADGAFDGLDKRYVAGRERELVPCGRINVDNLSKFDTHMKKIGRLLQFDEKMLEWITNRVKIESPYAYREVKPNFKSIIKALKSSHGTEKLNKLDHGHVVGLIVNEFELENKPEYLLDERKYRDVLHKKVKSYL